MHILGLQKTTLLDYPGLVASTVFTGGCNFRCPFCHNKDLVFPSESSSSISEDTFFDFLNRRKSTLQAVCISGGEPTLQQDLVPFINKIKTFGLKIKLDTNGFSPDVIETLLDNNQLDYIAVDVKNTKSKYSETTGVSCDLDKFERTLDILKASDIDYEFRTTIVKELHTKEDLLEISKWISFAPRYYLQSFQDSGNTICTGFHAHDTDTLKTFFEACKENQPNTFLRGIEIIENAK